jgi:hypothetical protein
MPPWAEAKVAGMKLFVALSPQAYHHFAGKQNKFSVTE